MPDTDNQDTNQSPPYEDVDLFGSDRPLQDAVRVNGAGAEAGALPAFGRRWGPAGAVRLGRREGWGWAGGGRRPRRSPMRSTPRGFAAMSSNSIRPTTR